MKIQPVGITQITQIIKDMNSSLSYGHDGIDMKALKTVADSIAAPIAHIINMSIQQEKFPSRWKLGQAIPIDKGGGQKPKPNRIFSSDIPSSSCI